jgi:3-oxoacyl-[acyl-carrier-protein] synthase III
MIRSVVHGVGAYLPENKVHNDALPAQLDTNHAWIVERTGIEQRHLAAEGEYTSHLGAHAAHAALKEANITANDIGLIVLATSTPDESLPSTATRIQAIIEAHNAVAFDVSAACGGFVYALHIADALLKTGAYGYALVIGAETMSRVINWEDRRTAILFGDGAGAMVLKAERNTDRGIMHSMIASDGSYGDLLHTDGGVSRTKTAGFLHMEGKEVFRHAVEKMSSAVEASATACNILVQNIDFLIPHQANMRILAACAKRLDIASEKVIATVAQHANTSAASIPLALASARKTVTIQQGNLVMLTALGAGFTWGSVLIRW